MEPHRIQQSERLITLMINNLPITKYQTIPPAINRMNAHIQPPNAHTFSRDIQRTTSPAVYYSKYEHESDAVDYPLVPI